MNYWNKKDELKIHAIEHTKEMDADYHNEIADSVNESSIFGVDFTYNPIMNINSPNMNIYIEDSDSVTAVMKNYNPEEKMAVLNFASYKNPGGMFLNGSNAQEENLCHSSFLYNVLIQFKNSYYYWNNCHKNRSLYLNRAIYSPNIFFFSQKKIVPCDVITCAAPNIAAAKKYYDVSDFENSQILRERINFILSIANHQNVDTLILGAFGCGVFGQNPSEVAGIFKELFLTTYKNCFNKVIFAIPSGNKNNYNSFIKSLIGDLYD